MKRIMFYGLLTLQILVILLFVYQFENIEAKGKEIQILTQNNNYHGSYTTNFSGRTYVEYEIDLIPLSKLANPKKEFAYNDKVYVLLAKSADGIFEVKEASDKRLKASNQDEVVVIGRANYSSSSSEPIRVNYNFYKIDDFNQYGEFTNQDTLKVTLFVSKFGQYKVKAIEKIDS